MASWKSSPGTELDVVGDGTSWDRGFQIPDDRLTESLRAEG